KVDLHLWRRLFVLFLLLGFLGFVFLLVFVLIRGGVVVVLFFPGLVLGFFLFVFVFFFVLVGIAGVQFVVGQEGRALVFEQREVEDAAGGIEVRFRLAQAPGRTDDGLPVAIGQEIKPLAVGIPGGAEAVDAVGGDGGGLAGVGVVNPDLRIRVVGGADIREPLAVGGPGEIRKAVSL